MLFQRYYHALPEKGTCTTQNNIRSISSSYNNLHTLQRETFEGLPNLDIMFRKNQCQ
jgi:hypothetical protein